MLTNNCKVRTGLNIEELGKWKTEVQKTKEIRKKIRTSSKQFTDLMKELLKHVLLKKMVLILVQ